MAQDTLFYAEQASIGTIAGGVPAVQTVATSGTIVVAGARIVRTTVAAAVTAVVMQAGTLLGQEVYLQNENATASLTITFAASGSSNVSAGASAVISGSTYARYYWTGAVWKPALMTATGTP